MKEKKLNFEQSMQRIEEIVAKLEKGDAALEESLALFEEGTALVKNCASLLDSAEQKVVRLMKTEDGTPAETEFEAGE